MKCDNRSCGLSGVFNFNGQFLCWHCSKMKSRDILLNECLEIFNKTVHKDDCQLTATMTESMREDECTCGLWDIIDKLEKNKAENITSSNKV